MDQAFKQWIDAIATIAPFIVVGFVFNILGIVFKNCVIKHIIVAFIAVTMACMATSIARLMGTWVTDTWSPIEIILIQTDYYVIMAITFVVISLPTIYKKRTETNNATS